MNNKTKSKWTNTWFPLILIILSLLFIAIIAPEVSAPELTLQDTTLDDWFELEQYQTSIFPIPEGRWTEHKFCNGRKWDFTENPITKTEAYKLEGGSYKYCINKITLKNPTTDFLSTTEFKYTITDMLTGAKDINFLIENPENPEELIIWENTLTKSWDTGLTLKIYAYGEKENPTDTLEWDFNLTYKPENLTFYKDPLWTGGGASEMDGIQMQSNNPNTVQSNSNDIETGVAIISGNYWVRRSIVTYKNWSLFVDSSATRINDVKLQLYADGPSASAEADSVTVNVHRMLRNWTTGEMCWNNATSSIAWGEAGANSTATDHNSVVINSTNVTTASAYSVNFSITNTTFESMMNGTLPNYGFLFRAPDSGEKCVVDGGNEICSMIFEDVNNADPTKRPMWFITYETLNNAPVIDNINLSSSLGLNTTTEDLIGDFNWSDPNDDPQVANQTYWWKDNVLQTDLENLTRISYKNTSIGEVWNFSARVYDGTEWSDWKNSSSGLLVLNSNPQVSFVSQDPIDLNGTYLGFVNTTWTVSDGEGVNASSVIFWYRVNSTFSGDWFFINGTRFGDFWASNQTTISNVTTTWYAGIYDNSYLPGVYAYDEVILENTTTEAYHVDLNNEYVKVKLYNVSNDKKFGFAEAMLLNETGDSLPLRVYYCNESYTTGIIPTSEYCTNFYTVQNSDEIKHHVHLGGHWHNIIPFNTNTSTGYLGDVYVTNISYFLMRGVTNSAKAWDWYYINNGSNTVETTVNQGISWTPQNDLTFDFHLHQYDAQTNLSYMLQACDVSSPNLCTNSTQQSDELEATPLPPTSPDVFRPLEGTYSQNISINWTKAISPQNDSILNYSVELLNYPDFTANLTILANDSDAVYYSWNSTLAWDGDYYIRVRAFDNNSLYSDGFSANFTINNLPNVKDWNITSNDPVYNFTNATFTAYWSINNTNDAYTWLANSSVWWNGSVRFSTLDNISSVSSIYTTGGETWTIGIAVQSSDGDWSEWRNASFSVNDFSPNVTSPVFNQSERFYDFQDIGYNFTVEDIDGQAINAFINITNNGVQIYTQTVSGLANGATYIGNLTQKNYNQTQSLDFRINVSNTDAWGDIRNSTIQIQNITILALDQWTYGVNETENLGYYLNISESFLYPYNINISAKFYRGSNSYTPSIIWYRNASHNNVTQFNVTFPTPLIPNNHTNFTSRWEWNYSIYGNKQDNNANTTNRSQTVDHGYFFTDWYSFPTLLLEAEKFLARINYTNTFSIASISNASFEVINGLNFSASLNDTITQIYHNQISTPLLGDDNSTTFTVSARANFTYDGITYLRNKNQSVTTYKMILGECARTWDEFNETSLYNISTHIYRMYNESDPTQNVTGSVKVTYDIFKTRTGEHRNFSFNLMDQWNHTVCIWPTWASFGTDTVIQYEGTNAFVPRTYYHYNLSLNNLTPAITNLYLIDDSIDQPINVYLYDQDDNPISKALLKLLKYYPEESLYRAVQVAESDSNGLALIKVQLNDALYKLEMAKAGVFLDQTDKFPFINTDYNFRLNLLAGFLDSFRKVGEIGTYLNKNNDTGTFSFYWNDPVNILQTACLEVIQRSSIRDTQLYYQCQNSSIGTLNYQIDTGVDGRYIATSTIETNTNDTEYFFETAEIIIENVTGSIFKIFGLLIVVMVFMTLASIGFSHNPASAVVLGVFAIIMATVLGILHLYMATIIILILITAVLIYFIRT